MKFRFRASWRACSGAIIDVPDLLTVRSAKSRLVMLSAAALLVSATAAGGADGKPKDHICPTGPAAEPPAAAVESGPQPPSALPAPSAQPARAVDGPLQVIGCVERAFPLRAVKPDQGAIRAVRLIEEPGSSGAIFAYQDTMERDRLIARWLARTAVEPGAVPPPTTVHIGGWQHELWRLPNGEAVHAILQRSQPSGSVCLVHARVNRLREALPVLNNWCMDRLKLWG